VKLCLISPTSGLEQFASLSDGIHLTLAHLISKTNKYTKYYKARKRVYGDELIMDNGAFEFKKPLSTDEIVEKAEILEPDYVVAPDYPYESWEKTVESTLKFIEDLKKRGLAGKYRIFAVPQSEIGDIKGWLKAFLRFQQIPEIDMIGMSILALPTAFCKETNSIEIETNRLYATKYLKNKGYVGNKKLHYLGGGDKIHLLSQYDIAYSLDTSSPIWHGFHGIRMDQHKGLLEGKTRIEVDFNAKIPEDRFPDIMWNIACMQWWSKGNKVVNFEDHEILNKEKVTTRRKIIG